MTNIELYINKKLCDIQSPDKLGVRLNRVLINPAELSTKDAQYSYSITIPATPTNDAIFGYANVEEVKNKFNHNYTAKLYVDSILIFDGRFKLSEIDSEGNYKGNLVVPAKKTIKEIFGEKKMNEIEGTWDLDVSDSASNPLNLVEMLNKYNTDKGNPECIFPLVLYGLLPKVAKDEEGSFTGKTIWDKYVRLGIEDFPPSINCIQTIERIFKKNSDEKNTYSIGGSALDDARLMNLYMSYQNPTTYQQEWNWGHLGSFKIEGSWTNYKNVNDKPYFEKYFYKNEEREGDESRWDIYTADLLHSSMLNVKKLEDHGTNVLTFDTPDTTNNTVKKNLHITIPKSGLYKINLDVTFALRMSEGDYFEKDKDNVYVLGENNHLESPLHGSAKMNNFSNSRYEVKLLRDFGGDIDITQIKLDGLLYKNNLRQERNQKNSLYFPMPSDHCVQMVDPLQNEHLIGGFRWGDTGYTINKDGKYALSNTIFNLAEGQFDTPYPKRSRILAIKNGWSWDKKYSQKNKIYSAINADGYAKLVGENSENDEDGNEVEVAEREWTSSKKFKVELLGTEKPNNITNTGDKKGTGHLNQVIWLEKGEHLSLVTVSDKGHRSKGGEHGWMVHDIDFTLEVQPFKNNYDWVTVDNNGTGIKEMLWNDLSDFKKDKINLIKFLPSEQKIDEWLDNFCKAFNLELLQPKEGHFELNVKQTRLTASAASVLDLDGKASIAQRTNQPLGLPSEFQLGFKINQEEEGYVKAEGKDGGGSFITGNIDGLVVTQTSNFSYNWFKKITKDVVIGRDGEGEDIMGTIELELPVIANKEIWQWDNSKDDQEMMKKLYTNYAQRFWYKNEKLDNVGVVWDSADKQIDLFLPHLENSLNGQDILNLDYYDAPNSILTTYFSIIATDDSNYTYVECFLTPDEYEQLDGSKLVQLNGDLYYIAAVEAYDPMGRNKTKLKLIRKV